MRNYEIMFIVRPTLSEVEIKDTAKNFEKILTDNGATVTNFRDMGQRELAYEINKLKTGYYFLINIQSNDDKAISEFDRLSRNNKDIVRHLITRIEE